MAELSDNENITLLGLLGLTNRELHHVLKRKLCNIDVAVIVDNSGSMATKEMCTIPLERGFTQVEQTRWEQACKFYDTMVSLFELGQIQHARYTMNSITPYQTKSFSRFYNEIGDPNGETPTIGSIERALSHGTKDILLIIITDGQPSDCEMFEVGTKIKELKRKYTRGTVYISFVACTENQTAVKFLDQIDRKIKNLDVTDDYYTEYCQVLRVTGKPMSYDQYITKAILGPIVRELDVSDETRCCTIL